MTKTVEFTGKTEDEAIELALTQLNLTRDDVSVEILERAKTGFLGLKSTPAVVRIQYEEKQESDSAVEDFLHGLFKKMDLTVDIELKKIDEDTLNITLTSQEPGALIGRRGETLDAIQHLTNYVTNRGSSSRIRINIDAENYRQRRNDTLEKLAQKTADRVIKTRRNMTLDPMNAYERHIIHSVLQDKNGISTYSVGSEPNRKVVIAYGQNRGMGGGRNSSEKIRSKPYSGTISKSNFNNTATDTVSSEQVDISAKEGSPAQTESPKYREWS